MQIIKKPGESLRDSFLEEGFVLDKVRVINALFSMLFATVFMLLRKC